MAKVIKMPVLGIAIANIMINEWFVEVGDPLTHGQALLEVQTDKITMEVPSEEAGVLLKTFFDKEAQLTDGIPIAIIGEAGEDISSLVSEVQAELQGVDVPQPELESTPQIEDEPIPEPEPVPMKSSGIPLATPLVKRIAREQGVDLSKVTPTGPGGRITKKDVLAYTKPTLPVERPMVKAVPSTDNEILEIIPISGTRKVIADNMLRSVQTAPALHH